MTSFDESGRPSFSYFRERWIKNCGQYRWIGAVHEVIPPSSRIVYSDIAISHKKEGAGDPGRNLRIYRKQLAEGKALDLRQQYYYGRELYYHKQYDEAVSVLEQFLACTGAVIPFASGLPTALTTVAGELAGLPAFVGFGSSAQGLTLLGTTIDITNASGTLSNFAFQVPRAGIITSFSAFFSTTLALSLVGSSYGQSADVSVRNAE